ncbi:histidine kinase dimerization/phospho-acceptor domain-containing protein, partial [Mycobacterium tuberculosis]
CILGLIIDASTSAETVTDKEQAENLPKLTEPPDLLVTLPENKFQLAKIRHELRTPINHIIGYSEILEEDVTEMGQLIFLDDLKRI